MSEETRILIRSEYDIVTARQQVRELCMTLHFSSGEQTLVATCVSELARNIVEYAGSGEIITGLTRNTDEEGIVIIAEDKGPGIPNIELAMKDGYSTSKGLGLGLPGSKRIMDEFAIVSKTGKGTTVTVKKWKKP
ncbi:MAG: anti-sigma regulatory factor [Syntrophales bacterium]|jgi:serine/threonine-protein kinase RsbT|nr:anti-sigma regulatory factor [Syntrophales bacterium]MCK9391502.1 anti-sigma regulatory factor [Syntrophales bacterium]